jgi:hypothetical protein
MDAQTFLGTAGATGKHWETDIIHIVTTSVSGNMQSWTADRECYLLGFQCSQNTNWHLYKNTTPATSLNATAGVYNQPIWDGGANASNYFGASMMFCKLVAGDILNFRITTATTTHCYLYIGYVVPDTVT